MRTLRSPWVLALLLVGCAGGWWMLRDPSIDDYPITNAAPQGSNIIVLGDSLTAGVGAGKGQGYVDELSRRMNVPILNRGRPGDTTSDALQRLGPDVLSHNPRIVILLLGGNDILRKHPIDQTFANLRTMIQKIQDKGALVILVGIASPMSGRYTSEFAKLARETGCPHIPEILTGIMGKDELMSDPIHPNANGYRVIADRIEPVLRKHGITAPAAGLTTR